MPNTFGDLLRNSLMQIHPGETESIESFMRVVTKRHPDQMGEEIPELYYTLLLEIFVAAHKTPDLKESHYNVKGVLLEFEAKYGELTKKQKDIIIVMAEKVFASFQPLDELIALKRRRKGDFTQVVDSDTYNQKKHGRAQGTVTFVPGLGHVKVSTQN